MILVMLGTQPHQFKRLVKYIDDLRNELNIKDEIVIQLGSTKYEFKNKNIKTYAYLDNLDDYIQKANVIITHGGVGAITKALENNKKVIAVPRKEELNEHLDNHQQEIVKKLSEDNYILSAKDYNELKENYKKDVVLKKYESNNKNFNDQLENLVQNLLNK